MINFLQHNVVLIFFLILPFILILIVKIFQKPYLGLYLTFFATGILLTPKLPIVREKLTAAEAFIALTWLALLFQSIKNKNNFLVTKSQINALLFGWLFVFWVFFSFVINVALVITDMLTSFIETINFIYGYLMFLTVVLMIRNWEQWVNCLKAWLWGAFVVSFFGVLAFTGHGPSWSYDEITHRISSTLRTENQVPMFLLPIFVILVFMIVQKGRPFIEKWVLTGLLMGIFLTTIGSGSRTSIIMLSCAVLGIGFVMLRESKFKAFYQTKLLNTMFFVLFGFLFYVVLALAGYKGDYSLMKTPAWKRPVVMLYDWSQGRQELDVNRKKELRVVEEDMGDNLFIGTGPRNYQGLYGVEEIHNTYAGVLIQTGIPGLTLFLIWLMISIFLGWRASKRVQDASKRLYILCMVVGMILLLLYGLTMFGLRQRNIWLLAGLLVSADIFIPRRIIHKSLIKL